MNGVFITFEGGEGSGKTTVIKCLIEALKTADYDIVQTREPGGIDIAEQIRNVILNVNNTKMTKETETLLYAASRMQHLSEKVLPALECGKIVICDRYLDSSLVYQGIARGIGIDNVLAANHFALKYMPNLTFFLDVKPEVGLARIKQRNEINRLDLENLDFHNKVYNGYLELCKMYPSRIVRIDASKTLEEIVKEVIRKTFDFLNK